ncbi:MAG: rhodanese-like domain-containing protein [Flavobacteriaceae bacterium]
MELDQKEWADQLAQTADAIILDVRTPEEYAAGHIPQAQLLNIREPQNFMDGLGALAPDKPYYVYCRSGMRSAQACQVMLSQGFNKTFNLLGGILEWEGPTE